MAFGWMGHKKRVTRNTNGVLIGKIFPVLKDEVQWDADCPGDDRFDGDIILVAQLSGKVG